jgi:hypothetical protein
MALFFLLAAVYRVSLLIIILGLNVSITSDFGSFALVSVF